jgi:putative ABC transport system permease protein
VLIAVATWALTGWALPLAGLEPPELPLPGRPGVLVVLGTTGVVFVLLAIVAAGTGRDLDRRIDRWGNR